LADDAPVVLVWVVLVWKKEDLSAETCFPA
jgi:hypothetical protein